MIEFINTLLFGVDYPGLSLALDPITMMLMAQGMGKVVQGGVQAFRGNQKEKDAQTIYDKQIADFRAGKFDNTLGQGVYNAATDQQNLLSNAANFAREGARSGIAGSVASTRYGDPRNNALLGIQNFNAINAGTNADMNAAMRIGGVGTELAGQEQGVLAQNQAIRQQLESMQMARAAGNIDLGSSMTDAGFNTAAGGLGDTVGARLGDGDIMDYLKGREDGVVKVESGGRVPSYGLGGLLLEKGIGAIGGGAGGAIGGRLAERGMQLIAKNRAKKGKDTGILGYSASDFDDDGNLTESDGQDITITVSKNGEVKTMANGGTAPQMLPGEFDHESNPIHMVDKNGEKVGEATGGELVFNPDQTNDIQEIISMGDDEALMAYMTKLLSKPQFQEEDDYEETTFA